MTAAVDAFRTMLAEIAAPSNAGDLSRYRAEPVLYARERLGVELLPHQECLLYAIAGLWHRITPEMAELAGLKNPGKRRIAVKSGQKTGKSLTFIVAAVWFFECFDGARAMMTAAISDQIRSVLWRELQVRLNAAPHKPAEEPSEDPARGLVSKDKTREIRGFTGRSIEAVAGISGNLLYLIDEMSHIEQTKYEAVDGNTAGEGDLGAPIVGASQGTRNEGPFFDAFHGKAERWTTMHFSSLEIAQYQKRTGRQVKGMATLAWCESKKEEYGEESVFYVMRVLGDFIKAETGRIITMHTIETARARWKEAPDDDDGGLDVGFDPAGAGDQGDELGFAAVRGAKCLEIHARRGLDEEAGLKELYFFVDKHRRPGESVRVKVDAEGEIGSHYLGRLRAEAEHRRIHSPATAFEVYGVRTSSKHVNDPIHYSRVRDEVWANLAKWMQTGAIPGDHKLEQELYAPEWTSTADGKVFATPKKMLKEALGRSPDRADALGLAVDPPRVFRIAVPSGGGAPPDHEANAWGYADRPAQTGTDPNSWGYE